MVDLSFLNPEGGPLLDLSLLGSSVDTSLQPENLNVETLNLYMPEKPGAVNNIMDGIGNILGQAMPFLFFIMVMQMMRDK